MYSVIKKCQEPSMHQVKQKMNKDEYNYQDSGSMEQSALLLPGASHSAQPCSAASPSLGFFYQQVKGLNI